MEIIEYYLINNIAREEIIMRGFKTVKANHTYSIRIKMMMDFVYSALDGVVLE
jgi:spore maturation protein CgeB